MRINADFSQPVMVHGAQMPWAPSPAPGVDRRMLFRMGEEVARATSLVRYAPGSAFPRHTHTGGEEIFVLEGVFQDEHGDYPAGSYFRNPPGTSHVPASAPGCTIFVRLWQFRTSDTVPVLRRPGEGQSGPWRTGATSAIILFRDKAETVSLENWAAGDMRVVNACGLELLVTGGELIVANERLEPMSWGRFPPGLDLTARVGSDGATVWLKESPLLHADVLPMPHQA